MTIEDFFNEITRISQEILDANALPIPIEERFSLVRELLRQMLDLVNREPELSCRIRIGIGG